MSLSCTDIFKQVQRFDEHLLFMIKGTDLRNYVWNWAMLYFSIIRPALSLCHLTLLRRCGFVDEVVAQVLLNLLYFFDSPCLPCCWWLGSPYILLLQFIWPHIAVHNRAFIDHFAMKQSKQIDHNGNINGLGAEGCCRSLHVLLPFRSTVSRSPPLHFAVKFKSCIMRSFVKWTFSITISL